MSGAYVQATPNSVSHKKANAKEQAHQRLTTVWNDVYDASEAVASGDSELPMYVQVISAYCLHIAMKSPCGFLRHTGVLTHCCLVFPQVQSRVCFYNGCAYTHTDITNSNSVRCMCRCVNDVRYADAAALNEGPDRGAIVEYGEVVDFNTNADVYRLPSTHVVDDVYHQVSLAEGAPEYSTAARAAYVPITEATRGASVIFPSVSSCLAVFSALFLPQECSYFCILDVASMV